MIKYRICLYFLKSSIINWLENDYVHLQCGNKGCINHKCLSFYNGSDKLNMYFVVCVNKLLRCHTPVIIRLWVTKWIFPTLHLDYVIGSTQLLNCQWNSSDIDTCQVLKYQSSQSYKVWHLWDLLFWLWGSLEYVCLWF